VNLIHLGYFEQFKSSDTLLMEGDAEGLRVLADLLRSLEIGSADHVQIDALSFVEAHHGVRLTVKRARRDRVSRVSASSKDFTWECTDAGWRDAADKVDVLVGCGEGHQYFDAAEGQVVVEVAKGEYGSDWWTRNG
jgi:hypothetical protein